MDPTPIPYSLSAIEIARLVGPESFSRGQRYADLGYVERLSWSESGNSLFGTVSGTRAKPYVVTVTFRLNPNGTAGLMSGACTCPVSSNCKHVAALLIASRTEADDRTAGTRQAKQTKRKPPPPPPPPPPWQTTLAPLIRSRRPPEPSTGQPLALLFELLAPISGRQTGNSQPPRRLGVRPMTTGRTGRWIQAGLTWDNLRYPRTPLNKAQSKVLIALYEMHSRARNFSSYYAQLLHLEDFPSNALWEQLAEARRAGVALITSSPRQDPLILSETPAEVALDIRRQQSDLALAAALSLNGRILDPRHVLFLGDPSHGIASWSRDDESHLTLAPLTTSVGSVVRNLATAKPVSVPAAEEEQFLSGYYPFLRDQLPVTSRDGSFELPEAARPVLALGISAHPDARIELRWEWHYLPGGIEPSDTASAGSLSQADEPAAAPRAPAPLYRHGLWPAASDAGYRNEAAEAEILRSLDTVLTPHPLMTMRPSGELRLAEHASLDGARMIDFLASAVPALNTSDDVIVNYTTELPDYREAEDAPLISLATTERPDDRDWFDLAVTVSVDGQEIPFDALFRALATEQELMILPGGTWFSLDRPELHQLRRLIEEARGLQDSRTDSLGLSRLQSDLWEELQELGIVTAQAATWRETIAGLTDAAQIPGRPLPDTVHATLRGYQQDGFDWLAFLHDHGLGGVLADDMGLGKTLQAIALIAHTRRQPADGTRAPFLVVAPTSVVPNWAAECGRFAPSLRVATITGTSARRASAIAELAAGADIVITSYTLFRLDFDEYDRQEWAGLLLDEAQFVKNHQARAHQCARRLKAPFKLAITGTPLENNLMELWSLLSITAPGLFPSPGRFAEYYQKPIEKEGDSDRLAQLRRRIRPFMLRRTKDQVAGDLPAKQEQVLELELHPKHRKVYQTHLQRERQKVLGLIEDLNANRFEIFRSLTMLRQLSLDASLYDEKYANIPSTKLDALLELLEDVVAEGHRTLIFSQFTGYLAKARARLDSAGIAYSYLDGKTRNRAKTIDDFKNGANPVFLISLKAGGFGLNLTEADYVILLDPWWNPATEAQAVDRTHRIGQTKHVMVYRLVAKDTIEEKVMALKSVKAALFDSVMTDAGAGGSALSAADIRELLA